MLMKIMHNTSFPSFNIGSIASINSLGETVSSRAYDF